MLSSLTCPFFHPPILDLARARDMDQSHRTRVHPTQAVAIPSLDTCGTAMLKTYYAANPWEKPEHAYSEERPPVLSLASW